MLRHSLFLVAVWILTVMLKPVWEWLDKHQGAKREVAVAVFIAVLLALGGAIWGLTNRFFPSAPEPLLVRLEPSAQAPPSGAQSLPSTNTREAASQFLADVRRETAESENRLNEEREQWETGVYKNIDRSKYVLDYRQDVKTMVVPRSSYDGPERFWVLIEVTPSCWNLTPDMKLEPDWNRTGIRGRGLHSLKASFGSVIYYDAYAHIGFLEMTGATEGIRAELRLSRNPGGPDLPKEWEEWTGLPLIRRQDRTLIVLASTCDQTIDRERQWRVWTPPSAHDDALRDSPFVPKIRLSWSLKPPPAMTVDRGQRIPPFVTTVRLLSSTTGEVFRQDFVIEVMRPTGPEGGDMVMWIRR